MSRITSRGLYVWDLTNDSFNHTQLAANWDTVDLYLQGFDTTTKLPKRINTSTTVPVAGMVAGDLVMLTATVSGYMAYTVLRYDGTNWRPVGYEIVPTVPTQGNFAGRVVILSTANGGFNAYDMIRFDGTAWAIVGGLTTVTVGGSAGLSISGDLVFTSGVKGVVFLDRTNGHQYRLYTDGGLLYTEQVS